MWDDFYGDHHEEPTSFTDTAQICMNGHIINDSFQKTTELNKKHCPQCGEPTITDCPECHQRIPGEIHYSNVIGAHSFKMPAYCQECGKPYPWTVTKLKAAKELIELEQTWEEMSKAEQESIEKSLTEITRNTPQATVGATRLNKLFMKLGSGAGDALKQIIVDVASETAKKVLLGK